MAKYWYEKWSIKWDDTGFRFSGSGSYGGKVDIATMVASEASSVVVGDVALSSLDIDSFNSGNNVPLRYVTSVSGDMSGSHKTKFGSDANKSWLTNQRIKNARQADVTLEEGSVPDDGIHTDGYWYVKVKKAFPSLRLNDLTIGGAKIKDSTGQVRAVGNVYFKDSTGTVGNLK